MIDLRPVEGFRRIVLAVIAGIAIMPGSLVTSPLADQRFPVGEELLLDAAPMRPAKRVPSLVVAPDGSATIDLWCKSVSGRVEVDNAAIKIVTGPLPEALPQMMAQGQCTPARMRADEDVLNALGQVTAWRRQGQAVLLVGPKPLKFRTSDH